MKKVPQAERMAGPNPCRLGEWGCGWKTGQNGDMGGERGMWALDNGRIEMKAAKVYSRVSQRVVLDQQD